MEDNNNSFSLLIDQDIIMGLNISGSIDRARNPERYPDRAVGPTFDPV